MVIVIVHCYAIYFPLCGLNVWQSVTFSYLSLMMMNVNTLNNKQSIITTITVL